MPIIPFKRRYTVPGLLLNRPTSYELKCNNAAVEIRLWNTDADNLKTLARLDVCRFVDVTPKRAILLRELEAKFMSADDCPIADDSNIHTFDSPATTTSFQFGDLPHPLQELRREVDSDFVPLPTQALRLLRWRYGKWSQFSLSAAVPLCWQNEETQNWFRYPRFLEAPGEFGLIQGGMSFHEPTRSFLEGAINRSESEPIGHSLLQQAYDLHQRDSRASIVLGVSAVEVAIKSLISDRVKDAEWLAFNMPMPPVEKIIQEYIGKLFLDVSEDEYGEIFPKEVLQALRKYVALRNAIAHRGQDASSTDAWKTCDGMRDVLFRLDYVVGNKWAKDYWKSPSEYGRNSTRSELKPTFGVMLQIKESS